MKYTTRDLRAFNTMLKKHFRTLARDLPWRRPEPDGSFDPYKIMVSELMLQQTQVPRVIPKYEAFLRDYPSVTALAAAPLSAVLTAWSGLGYNRRAKFLHQAAKAIVEHFAGSLPATEAELLKLPGIGKNTAGAIMAYAYNQPAVFVETNIRTVYIHHFFHDQMQVPDTAILPLIAQTLDTNHPREFYWALMDYGSYLKKSGNAARQSRHYKQQSAFHGSLRAVRGQVLKQLIAGPLPRARLHRHITDDRLPAVLKTLAAEGLIVIERGRVRLAD